MKKITLSTLAILGALAINAQTQRMVMIEEFTNASCGPCASQNPAFNALIDANPTKVVALKYQTNWPGFDPFNAQNPSEVSSRVTYYGVNGVPHGAVDGTSIANDCNAYAGAPACLSQAEVDARYAVSADFSISLSHTLSADLDSAFINITVTNMSGGTFTSNGNMVLQTALTEREVVFASAPGSNGEVDFYDVMRKMIPNASGTALPSSWTAGQSQTFAFAVALPSYIYNYGEVGVVAFVQMNGNKEILNAAKSAPQPITGVPDAGLTNSSAGTSGLCDGTFTPTFTLANNDVTTVTSATVSYTINGGAPVNQAWTGSLAQGQSAAVTFPTITLPGGTNEVVGSISNVNGSADYNTMNNITAASSYSVISNVSQPSPYDETFEGLGVGSFPSNWVLSDPTGRVFSVTKNVASGLNYEIGGFGASETSLRFDYWSMQSGATADIYFEKVNLTGQTNSKIWFDHAYCQYQSENDALEFAVSTDCGATWTTVFSRAGTNLATRAPKSNGRLYPTAAEWTRTDINISAYDGQNDILIRMRGISDFGNCLYVDNIYVNNTAISVEENNLENNINLFPNPANNVLNVAVNLTDVNNVNVEVLNAMGQAVATAGAENVQGEHTIKVDVANLAAGIYMVRTTVGTEVAVKQVSITR